MITAKDILAAHHDIITIWGEQGKKVIEECAKVTPFNDDVKAFLEHCTTCGGNWGGMFLTGINKLYPNVYDAIPDDMGIYAWQGICSTLTLCGVNTSE